MLTYHTFIILKEGVMDDNIILELKTTLKKLHDLYK